MVELDRDSKRWLEPMLKQYGAPIPDKQSVGGWQLSVTTKKGVSQNLIGTLNSSDAAYKAIMKASILPKAKPGAVVRPKPGAMVVVRPGPRVMLRSGGVDAVVDVATTMMVMRQLDTLRRQQMEERIEEDADVAAQAAAAAQAASVRSATRVKQRTMTKRKVAGRIRVHGYSRRSGSTVRDFRRNSPRA